MNEQQAIALVQKTFKSAFDRSGYIHFLRNLLNEFDDEGARSNQGARIPDKFQNYVEKLERVGKYLVDEHEIMLFIVYLKNDTSIERARTMQRNFVASYLQKDMKDAALVAFVSKDPADWRFSFIKMEYRYDEQENKIKEEFTPAKRWSFLVGANETSHTAQRKLVPIMADDDHNPTLAELEEAFNIEKVTKEFFEKYRELFIRTKDELDKIEKKEEKVKSDFASKGIDTVNLAKKLLGQIIFLYYLQKKGWFGVARNAKWGDGSRNFLRELFDKKHGDYKNFFNDILEPLFYDALRIDRSHDDHYYSRFNCKIPFLNGGLFDPMNNYDWVNTDILLSNELFHNKTKTKEGDEGDGILDIFDRYNFTVKEDEPFEKEVAIDPELLGKAYEKFNAIRPDNYDEFLKALKSDKKGDENKFNKLYGVYYTPREIVHYMCQQSLINYLYSELNPNVIYQSLGDDKLDMFGNAVKSGQLDLTAEYHPITDVPKEDIATLILLGEQIKEHDERVVAEGRETRDYPFLMPESIRNNMSLIDEKLANIKVCDPAVGSGAFPVGMMSEVVRARDVLKIWTKTKKTVYDFKRQCIENSLYGVDIDSGAVEIAKLRLWLSLIVDEDDIQNIKPLPNLDYKIVCGNSLLGVEKNLFNMNLFTELEILKPLYFNSTNPTKKQETKKKIDGLIDQITDGRAQFDFEIYFSEVFHEKNGFDLLIGNPPYLESRHPDFGDKLKDAYQLFAKKRWKDDSAHITRGSDLLIYFFENSIFNIRESGQVVLLTQNSWLDTEYGKKFQRFLLKNTKVKRVVDSDFRYFASDDGPNINAIITVFEGKKSNSQTEMIFARYHENFEYMSVPNIVLSGDEDSRYVETHKYKYSDKQLKDIKWGVLLSASDEILRLLQILDEKGLQLEKVKAKDAKFSYGQGLNLSKDCLASKEILDEFEFAQKAKIPFLTSDDGAIFKVTQTKYHLIDETKLSKSEVKQLLSKGIKAFNSDLTRKIPPKLMMPRGISKHYCVLNNSNAYSSSFVDVYCYGENIDESIILNLWLFFNSSVGWLVREINGRKNLGGGLLKAEAVDLESIPVYMDFEKTAQIKSLVQGLAKRKALNTVEEIDTIEHREIDKIVFDYLGMARSDSAKIIDTLKTKLLEREGKAKS